MILIFFSEARAARVAVNLDSSSVIRLYRGDDARDRFGKRLRFGRWSVDSLDLLRLLPTRGESESEEAEAVRIKGVRVSVQRFARPRNLQDKPISFDAISSSDESPRIFHFRLMTDVLILTEKQKVVQQHKRGRRCGFCLQYEIKGWKGDTFHGR